MLLQTEGAGIEISDSMYDFMLLSTPAAHSQLSISFTTIFSVQGFS